MAVYNRDPNLLNQVKEALERIEVLERNTQVQQIAARSGITDVAIVRTEEDGDVVITADGQVQIDLPDGPVLLGHGTTANAANCWIGIDGEVRRSTSSSRYKENIADYAVISPSTLLNHLRLRVFRTRGADKSEHPDHNKVFIGYVAEEVFVTPAGEWLTVLDEGGVPDAINYQNITILVVEAIKELRSEALSIRQQITTLQQKGLALENTVATLEARVAALEGSG